MVQSIRVLGLLIFIIGQGQGTSDCCGKKKVGDRTYKKVSGHTENYPECSKDCVYEEEGQPGLQYCFKAGQLPVTCLDSLPTTPTTTTITTTATTPSPSTVTATQPGGIMALFIGPAYSSPWEILLLPSLETANCTIPDLPTSMYSYAMMSDESGINICGSRGCHLLSYNNDKWLSSPADIPSMNKRRVAAGSVVFDDGVWWLSGGNSIYDPIKSTEVRRKKGTWKNFVKLPVPLGGHCMVNLHNDKVLMTGGVDDTWFSLASTYLFDRRTNTYQRLDSMKQARAYHTCTLIDEENVLVATGVYNYPGYSKGLKSSEVFNVKTGKWESGPDIPIVTSGAQMLTFNNITYHVGGAFGTGTKHDVYRLDKIGSSASSWKFTKVKHLKHGKYNFGMSVVEIDPADCNGWQ